MPVVAAPRRASNSRRSLSLMQPAPQPAKESTGGGGAAMPGTYQTKTAHALIRGYVTPAVGAAGQQAQLVITVEPIGGYHVYALADHDPKRGSKPTLIVLDETSGLKPATPAVAGKVIEKASAVTPGETDQYYEQSVTWTIDLSIPQGAKAGEYPLAGLIGFQTCREETGCDLPHGVAFSAVLPITATSSDGKIPLTFSPAKSYKQVADLAAEITAAAGQPAAGAAALDLSQLQPDTPKASEQSLTKMMGYGFLAGMILNLMPCVLPVIGLKILSFVEQSGQERGRVLWLNIWYSLGILSVFWCWPRCPWRSAFIRKSNSVGGNSLPMTGSTLR